MSTEDKILTKDEQKDLAVKALTALNCYKPYLDAYKKKGIITMYEGYGGYYLDPKFGSHEDELMQKIHAVEETYGGTVYAVIHNLTAFGECYSLLYMSKYDCDKESMWGQKWAYAYVWNKTYDDCSEFGSIGVRSVLGGLVRTD